MDRADYMVTKANDLAECMVVLRQRGLYASQGRIVSNGEPVAWIDRPPHGHPIRRDAVVYMQRPMEGGHELALASRVEGVQVVWLEDTKN